MLLLMMNMILKAASAASLVMGCFQTSRVLPSASAGTLQN
jgi:hypothetical protein